MAGRSPPESERSTQAPTHKPGTPATSPVEFQQTLGADDTVLIRLPSAATFSQGEGSDKVSRCDVFAAYCRPWGLPTVNPQKFALLIFGEPRSPLRRDKPRQPPNPLSPPVIKNHGARGGPGFRPGIWRDEGVRGVQGWRGAAPLKVNGQCRRRHLLYARKPTTRLYLLFLGVTHREPPKIRFTHFRETPVATVKFDFVE